MRRTHRYKVVAGILAMLVGSSAVGALRAGAIAPKAGPTWTLPSDFEPWTMFHHDPGHSGVSREATISKTSAPTLGVRWQVNVGGAAYSTPLVLADPTRSNAALVYQANLLGFVTVYDAATGNRLWSRKIGGGIASSPAYSNGVIYIGSVDHNLYAINATTGSTVCRYTSPGVIDGSPVVANPDGSGAVVYVGDNGLSGADDGGDVLAVNAVDPNSAVDCSLKWRFSSFGNPPGSQPLVGSWSPTAVGRDKNGRMLVLAGSSSPEGAEYAFDAVSGTLVWRYQTIVGTDSDIGAGATVSAPGVNGFADGIVYFGGKDGYFFAVDLTTGAPLWQFNLRTDSPTNGGTRSTATLVGSRIYVGSGTGVYAFDAITGAELWMTAKLGTTTAEIIAATAASGPAGGQVLLAADVAGTAYAFDLATGAKLWSYKTGATVLASPIVSAGSLFVSNVSGILTAFGPGGAVGAVPDTTIVAPTSGSTIPNPNGVATVASGTATDAASVASVLVALRENNTGRWWDATAKTWSSTFVENAATLTQPSKPTTGWTMPFVPTVSGGNFYLQADAVNASGLHDPIFATSTFGISSALDPPDTAFITPALRQIFYFPNGVRQRFPVQLWGWASDFAGAHPGIAAVYVVVKNIQHAEYWCGAPGCAGGDGQSDDFTPTYSIVKATLSDPGSTTTGWAISFPVYDHPHSYRLIAYAVDNDGQVDPFRATVDRICVRDVGDKTCAG